MTNARRAAWICLAVLLLGTFAFFAAWPIVAYDQDLWEHLSYGRRIVETGAVPAESFYSFLSPPPPMLDYSWLFQVLVYGVHAVAGWAGLVAVRAALAAGILGGVVAHLLRRNAWRPTAYTVAVTALYAAFMIPRLQQLRPHLLCYACIVASIAALDGAPRGILWLPAIAWIWANTHGISYPILAAILFAFLLERRPSLRRDRRAWTCAALALLAVLATPDGWRLLPLPFKSGAQAVPYASELWPIAPRDLLSFAAPGGAVTPNTAFNVLLLLGLLSTAAGALRRPRRPSRLVLAAAGAALLAKYDRSRYECALLLLPALGDGPPFGIGGRPPGPGLQSLAAVAATALSLVSVRASFGLRAHYPCSRRFLPVGVAAFLRRVDAGGTVLNDPYEGGFLEWSLYPRYRIALDAQFSGFDGDVSWAFRWRTDPAEFARTVARYRPDFIVAPLDVKGFGGIVRRSADYVPVFFDDAAALYADRRRRPDVARRYRLPVDPFALPKPDGVGAEPAYLARMIAEDPGGLKTTWRAARYALARRDFTRADAYGAALIEAYPETSYGYSLKAEALGAQGRAEDALVWERRAQARPPASEGRPGG